MPWRETPSNIPEAGTSLVALGDMARTGERHVAARHQQPVCNPVEHRRRVAAASAPSVPPASGCVNCSEAIASPSAISVGSIPVTKLSFSKNEPKSRVVISVFPIFRE